MENFLKLNYGVIVTYFQDKGTDFIQKMEKKYDCSIDSLYLNLCEEDSIKNLYDYIKNKYGKLDVLINNAAVSIDEYYLYKEKNEFMKVIETNLIGTFLMMKYYDSYFTNGYIFNISSTDGIDTGSIYSLDYNASKAGINILTQNIALESPNKLFSICPNWVDTRSTKMIDQDYLKSELKRIKQKQLINPDTIFRVINKCLNEDIPSGSILRIDGDDDVRRIS